MERDGDPTSCLNPDRLEPALGLKTTGSSELLLILRPEEGLGPMKEVVQLATQKERSSPPSLGRGSGGRLRPGSAEI